MRPCRTTPRRRSAGSIRARAWWWCLRLGRGPEFLGTPGLRPPRHRRRLRRGGADPRPVAARRLHHHPAGDEELPAVDGTGRRTQDQGDDPRHPARRIADKEQILELYLNEIFLGQNSYGVAAAAQTYFNKTLDQLTPEEAAYLAALPQAPSLSPGARLRPRHQPAQLRAARDVRERLYRAGRDGARHRRAAGNRAGRRYRALPRHLPPRDYFTDEIRRQLSPHSFGEDDFFGGGYAVRASMDEDADHGRARCVGRWKA
jgi:hypothetical protein